MRYKFIKLILAILIANLLYAGQMGLFDRTTGDGDVFAQARGMMCIVEGETGCGSGFIAASNDGNKYFYTNKHVVEGQKKISVRLLNGGKVALGVFQYAEGLDIVRFSVDDTYASLAIIDDVPSIGDKIFVVGNSTGAGVVTEESGAVLGVGPDRIEVSAKFVPGNSGSPILDEHGNVIGIATYAAIFAYEDDWRFAGTRYANVRRFALRISNAKWVSADIHEFYDEYQRRQLQRRQDANNRYTRTWLQYLNDKLARFMSAANRVCTAEEVFQKVKQSRNALLRFNDAWGHEFRFEIVGNKSFLTSSGADGRFGTSDDLSITNLCAYSEDVLDFAAKQEIIDKESLVIAKQRRLLLTSKYISDNLKQATGFELDSWYNVNRFPCCVTKLLGMEYFCSRCVKAKSFRLFSELFSTYYVALTAKSTIVYAINIETEHPVPRERFDRFVDFIGQESDLEVKIATNEFINTVSSKIEFGDGRALYVSHDSNGMLSCCYSNQSTYDQVLVGFESSDVMKLPQLDSFLGIPVGGDFEPLIPKLRKPKMYKKYAVAEFIPDKRFMDFDNYEVVFSLADGKIGMIQASRQVKVDKEFTGKVNEIIIALEKKFMRKFHLHKDIDAADAWTMHFLKPMVYPKDIMGFGEYVAEKGLSVVIVRAKEASAVATISIGLFMPSICKSFLDEFLDNATMNNPLSDVNDAFK